jgi:hypothetical protein
MRIFELVTGAIILCLAGRTKSPLVDARLTTMNRSGFNSTIECVNLVGDTMSMKDHMQYKATVILEGNDVASGLKWALLSNSVVIMATPTFTSWALEELLEPWVHYIPMDLKLMDVAEKMQWVFDHDGRSANDCCQSKSMDEGHLLSSRR